jgi:hypothetical protein
MLIIGYRHVLVQPRCLIVGPSGFIPFHHLRLLPHVVLPLPQL